MSPELRRLRLRQLDAKFAHLGIRGIQVPRGGWIKEIRHALGMTGAQLAKRLGLTQSTVTALEASEAKGKITLDSLQKAARAMDCELVYAIVPRTTLQDILTRKIRQVARESVQRVANTMALEEQGVSQEHLSQQEEELVQAMLANPPRRLWE